MRSSMNVAARPAPANVHAPMMSNACTMMDLLKFNRPDKYWPAASPLSSAKAAVASLLVREQVDATSGSSDFRLR